MNLKAKSFLLVGITLMAVGLSGCALPVMLYQSNKMDRKIAAMHGRKYVYTVKPAPAFLTEELAIAKAWVTLAREGFNTNEWTLVRDLHSATAPDGNTLATASADKTVRLWRALPFTETDAEGISTQRNNK